jgi:acyl dehydratase
MNTNPIHFDSHLAKQTPFGQPLVDSCLTLSIVTGISVNDLSQNAIANLAWTEIELPNPVYNGDTIYAQSEILNKRESKSRPYAGIVEARTTGYKADGTVVITYKRTFMVYKRSHRMVEGPPGPQPDKDRKS